MCDVCANRGVYATCTALHYVTAYFINMHMWTKRQNNNNKKDVKRDHRSNFYIIKICLNPQS